MDANTSNAVVFLVSSVLNLYLCVVFLRIVLSYVRADFYNPVSQLVWKATQPVVGPLQKLLPRWRRLDVVAIALLAVVAVGYVHIVSWLYDQSVGPFGGAAFALLKVIVLALQVYTVSLTFQAILTWFGPGVNNPSSNILWSVNEPLLRPVRRAIPPAAGLDLSPLILIVAMQFVAILLPLAPFYRQGILG